MHQRIDSWSSKGYIFALSTIPETDLERVVSNRAGEISALFADQNNHALATTVADMIQSGDMERVVMVPTGYSERNFASLITSLGRTTPDAPQHADGGT